MNVYVDGSFYLYTGQISPNLSFDSESYVPESVAETVCTNIYNTIQKLKKTKKVNVGNVYVFFDGVKSKSKYRTMCLRRQYQEKRKSFDVNMIKNKLIELLNDHGYIINNLIVGECEHEMFLHRDVNKPSLMLTDDSDLFHIGYGYSTRTYNDYCYVATKGLHFTCNLFRLHHVFNGMPKFVFALLCSLKGSDYTHDTFTTSMMSVILDEFICPSLDVCRLLIEDVVNYCRKFKDRELSVYNQNAKQQTLVYNTVVDEDSINLIEGIYSMDDVCFCTKKMLLLIKKSTYKCTWNPFRKKNGMDDVNGVCDYVDIFHQLEAILWTVNYSLIGCKYDCYFATHICYPIQLDVYKMYYFLLNYEGGDVYSKLAGTDFTKLDVKRIKK